MPIFEYECANGHRVEKMLKSWRDRNDAIPCESKNCDSIAVSVPSLVSMQPDEYWHGKYVPNVEKVFTSKKRMKQYMKENRLARVEEGHKVSKPADPGAVARRLHVEKHLEGYAT